jgi:zinc transporter ZupT
MNPTVTVIAANLAAAFVIICGIKLFDIGSEFADLIRRYGIFLGLVIAFVTIFNFLLVDTAELVDDTLLYWTVFVSMISFAILGRLAEATKRLILVSKKKRKKVSTSSVLVLALIDILIGVVYGAVSGVSFMVTTGTGVMVLCAIILLRLMSKVTTIGQYQTAGLSRRQNILIFSLSLIVTPAVAILCYLLFRSDIYSAGVYMASATGFLVYLCLLQITTLVVKKYKNR